VSRRFLLMLLLLAFAGGAAGEPQRYVVGVEQIDYYPVYAVRDGEYVGAAREILDAFADDLGIEFIYRPLPVTRLTSQLLRGEIDFKFPDHPDWSSAEREGRKVSYSRGVIAYIDGVMVRPERKGREVADFRTLGTVTGFTPFAWLDPLATGQVRLVENPQMRALQRQVIAGRIDGAYANIAVATYILEERLQRPGALQFDPGLPHTRSDYYLSSVLHRDLIKRFSRWLQAHEERVATIKKRYGAERGVE